MWKTEIEPQKYGSQGLQGVISDIHVLPEDTDAACGKGSRYTMRLDIEVTQGNYQPKGARHP